MLGKMLGIRQLHAKNVYKTKHSILPIQVTKR